MISYNWLMRGQREIAYSTLSPLMEIIALCMSRRDKDHFDLSHPRKRRVSERKMFAVGFQPT